MSGESGDGVPWHGVDMGLGYVQQGICDLGYEQGIALGKSNGKKNAPSFFLFRSIAFFLACLLSSGFHFLVDGVNRIGWDTRWEGDSCRGVEVWMP